MNFFSHAILGHTRYFDFKPSFKYTSQKKLNRTTIDKICLNRDCIDESIPKGNRKLILLSFASDKPP